VTRAYLEGFLKPSERQLICYGRSKGPFPRSPEDLASQRNYYAVRSSDGSWDDSIEKMIGSAVEDPGLPVIQKLASGRTALTRRERNRLSLLIAFQEMRTPAMRERARALSKALNARVFEEVRASDPQQTSVELVGKSGPKVVTFNEMNASHDDLCGDHSMQIHRSLMGTGLKLAEYYNKMKFTVYYARENEEFVTTDTPVIRVFHDSAPLGTGINRLDVEIRFPLSRKAFLTLTHDLGLIRTL
jgi:hypothetical protein